MVPEAELASFFKRLSGGFSLVQREGHLTVNYRIAGRIASIDYGGTQDETGLWPLHRPLQHLALRGAVVKERPTLSVKAWAGPAHWSPPAYPWTQDQQWYLGEIAGLESERFLVNSHPPSGLLCMLDRSTGEALYWLPRAQALPYWEIAAPFRIIINAWASSFDGHLVHAAVVGKENTGVLLAGRGGKGKSTLALACVDAGWHYLGDDYVLLTGRGQAHSVYNSAKSHSAFLAKAMPQWVSKVAERIGPENKSLIFMKDSSPEVLRDTMPIRAIVIPQVTGNTHASLVRRPAAEGLLALAPSTMFQVPGTRQTVMAFCAQWMRGLPTYTLETGRDLASGPTLLGPLLDQANVCR